MTDVLLLLILLVSFGRWWMMIRIIAQKTRDPIWYAMREMYVVPIIELQRRIHTAFALLKKRFERMVSNHRRYG